MNFLNNPANNGLKMLLLVVVLAGAGAFAYSINKNDSLQDTGQVLASPALGSSSFSGVTTTTHSLITGTGTTTGTTGTTGTVTASGTTGTASGTTGTGTTGTTTGTGTTGCATCTSSTTGGTSTGTGNPGSGTTGTGTTGMGTTGTDPLCTNSTPINVTPAALSITSGLLHFDTSVQDGGHYQLVNVTPCAVKITQMNLALVSTYYPSTVSGKPVWQPIGGIIPNTIFLHTGNSITGTPLFGASVKGPLTPVTGPRLMTFTSTAGVIIPPYSSQDFTLEISSWNMPPGGTLALELYAFRAVKTLTGATLTWAQPTSGIAASVVTAPSLTLVNP